MFISLSGALFIVGVNRKDDGIYTSVVSNSKTCFDAVDYNLTIGKSVM